MSHVKSSVAPLLPRIGLFGDVGTDLRAAPRVKTAPSGEPDGAWHSLRGKVLYPAILTVLALAAHLVSRNKDETR